MPRRVPGTVFTMKHPLRHTKLVFAPVLAASVAAGLVFVAPANADPPSGNSTTVEMTMPGPNQFSDTSGSRDSYHPPAVTMAVQSGSGGVDRDGTTGVIDPYGTQGNISGPLMRAVPEIRAEPAPLSPRVRS